MSPEAEAAMRFHNELSELAELLRVGAGAARTIAARRGQDEAAISKLVAQAEAMAVEIDSVVGYDETRKHRPDQAAATFRLRRDR